MTRLQRLNTLKDHPMLGKDFKRLSMAQLIEIEIFITDREHLNDDDFMHDANRFKMDDADRNMKVYAIQWALITATVDTVSNLKRRGEK